MNSTNITELVNTSKLTFNDLFANAENIQKDCFDYGVSNAGINSYLSEMGEYVFTDDFGVKHYMPLQPWGQNCLCEKIGVPPAFLDKCYAHGFNELSADIVNSFLGEKTKTDFFVRSYQNRVRGILSKRYSPCDAPDILDGLLGDIIDEKEWNIKGHFFNEERLHVRFVKEEPLNVDNEVLFPALVINSSDVGRCSLNVAFYIYRLACTNGLLVPEITSIRRQVHLGIKKDRFFEDVRHDMANMKIMIANAEELINLARAKKVKMTTPEEIDALLAELHSKAKLDKDESKAVLQFLTDGKYEMTRWGLVNSITEYARDQTLETRLNLERSAGLLLKAA